MSYSDYMLNTVPSARLTLYIQRRIYIYIDSRIGSRMAKARKRDTKREALARDGALNPHPEAIRDALFTGNPFFDAQDLVPLRYAIVRRHRVDGVPIRESSTDFGVARPT